MLTGPLGAGCPLLPLPWTKELSDGLATPGAGVLCRCGCPVATRP